MGGPGRGMVRISSAHTRLFVLGAFVLSSCERSLGSSSRVGGWVGGVSTGSLRGYAICPSAESRTRVQTAPCRVEEMKIVWNPSSIN